VSNTAKTGAVKERLRCQGETWDVALPEPGAKFVAETYGRWAPWVPFRVETNPKERPMADVVLLVISGWAEVTFHDEQWALKAPPGPAGLHWNNETGADESPFRQDKLPAWFAEDPESERGKTIKRVCDRFAARVKEKGLGP